MSEDTTRDDAPETDPADDAAAESEADAAAEAEVDETPEAVAAERDKLRRTLLNMKQRHARQLEAAKSGAAKDPVDDAEAKARAEKETHRVKRMAGIAALTAEGMTREQAKVAVGLLDFDAIEVDEDGDADLEDVIADLKSQFPGMFAKQADGKRKLPPARTGDSRREPEGVLSKESLQMLKQVGLR